MQVSDPFSTAAPGIFGARNPVMVTGADSRGNVEGVTANGTRVLADPTGIIAGFSLSDALTAADKQAVGYDPGSGKINGLAIALANYRVSGALTGPASPALIDALKTSLANTGGYPADPTALMKPPSAPSSSFSYDALSTLLTTQDVSVQPAGAAIKTPASVMDGDTGAGR